MILIRRVILTAITAILLICLGACGDSQGASGVSENTPVNTASDISPSDSPFPSISPYPSQSPSQPYPPSSSESPVPSDLPTQTVPPSPRIISYTLKKITIAPVEILSGYFTADNKQVKYEINGGVRLQHFSVYISNETDMLTEFAEIYEAENADNAVFTNTEVKAEFTSQSFADFTFTAKETEDLTLYITVELYSYYFSSTDVSKGSDGSRTINIEFRLNALSGSALIQDIRLGGDINDSAGMTFNIQADFEITAL